MKHFTLIVASVLALALATSAHAENFKRIKSEADFRKHVVDKKLTADDIWMTIQSNGQTKGFMFEKNFAAAWVRKNNMYCRNAVLGKKKLGTDCQVVRISGKNVEFIRELGKGPSGIMKLP